MRLEYKTRLVEERRAKEAAETLLQKRRDRLSSTSCGSGMGRALVLDLSLAQALPLDRVFTRLAPPLTQRKSDQRKAGRWRCACRRLASAVGVFSIAIALVHPSRARLSEHGRCG